MPSTQKSTSASKKRQNQAGRPTAAELERRKARVMEVATSLFIEHGYSATSLIDIARGAGVATRTLYQHFGDKEALFREVIYARDTAGALDKPVLQDGDTAYDALLRAAHYALAITFRAHSIGLMRLMIAESQRFPDFMKQTAVSIFARFNRNIENVFIALEKEGIVPPGDHGRSADLFADVIHGSRPLMTYTDWQAGPPSEEELRERIEFFIRGWYGEEFAKSIGTRRVSLPARAPA